MAKRNVWVYVVLVFILFVQSAVAEAALHFPWNLTADVTVEEFIEAVDENLGLAFYAEAKSGSIYVKQKNRKAIKDDLIDFWGFARSGLDASFKESGELNYIRVNAPSLFEKNSDFLAAYKAVLEYVTAEYGEPTKMRMFAYPSYQTVDQYDAVPFNGEQLDADKIIDLFHSNGYVGIQAIWNNVLLKMFFDESMNDEKVYMILTFEAEPIPAAVLEAF